MATKEEKGKFDSMFLAFLLALLIVVAVWLFVQRRWWFPEMASAQGSDIDRVFYIVLAVTGIAFVLVQSCLALFVARYRAKGTQPALYWYESHRLEITWTLVTAVILTILVFMGQRVWSAIYFSQPPEEALSVEVIGEQFMWNIRYPGKDNTFGRTDPRFITVDNPLGLDKGDPAARDDVVVLNLMQLPVNRPVRVRLGSKDVIHSFFLPHFRVKQDAVPGMKIDIWFTPNKTGEYEIACAELCGLGHYRMQGRLTVVGSQEEFESWLAEQASFQQ